MIKKIMMALIFIGLPILISGCTQPESAQLQQPQPETAQMLRHDRDVTIKISAESDQGPLTFAVDPWEFDIRHNANRDWVTVLEGLQEGDVEVEILDKDKPGGDCELPPAIPTTPEPGQGRIRRGPFKHKDPLNASRRPVDCRYNIQIRVKDATYIIDPDYRIWP